METKDKMPAYLKLVSPQKADELSERIVKMLFVQKRYKEKSFSAKRLAEELGTNTRYVSIVLSTRFHSNYNSLVNKLRIDEAMSIIADKRYQDLKIQDISDMVGFANRQSFYNAFCKIAKTTPLQYKSRFSDND